MMYSSLFDRRTPEFPTIPDVTLHDPQNRRIKVITVGAGVAGILSSYNIQKNCENVDHVVYEKNADIGGTWFENHYPGCACDVPSHAYAYHFAPNPDWPRYLSKREDIWSYLDRVCRVFDLRKYMRFNVHVIGAFWDEDLGQWRIKLRRQEQDGRVEEWEDICDVFLYCTGILNNWTWPSIEGLSTFKGRTIHTARWPEEYQEHQWKGERVVIIGSGASSLQVVPSMQPHVGKMDIFVRTGVWFAPLVDELPEEYLYSQEEIETFRRDPEKLIEHIKLMDSQLNKQWPVFFAGSEAQTFIREKIAERMAQLIQDERLLKGFTPSFAVGCRRVTPGENYLRAIQSENVAVHFTPVTKVVPEGVIGADDILREADTVICATGFDVSFRPRFPIVGKDGASLSEMWRDRPWAYFGLTVPNMPNFMMQGGPPSPVQNGTPFGAFHASSDYAIHIIKKLQRENVRSLHPKQHVVEAFARHVDDFFAGTVFSDACRSWYKDNQSGRVNAVWPGSALHYRQILETPRWEDYEVQSRDEQNMFSWMGLGFVKEHRIPGADLGFYLSVEKIDPLWGEEIRRSYTSTNSVQNGASKNPVQNGAIENPVQNGASETSYEGSSMGC